MVRSITRLFINVVQAAVLLCIFAFPACAEPMILSILVDTLNSYKEDSYAAIGRAA